VWPRLGGVRFVLASVNGRGYHRRCSLGNHMPVMAVMFVTHCFVNAQAVHMTCSGLIGFATSMIDLCQEGNSSPDALRRSASANSCWFFAVCVGLSAVIPISYRTRLSICCLRPASDPPQKIEFVISCQSRNLLTGASRARDASQFAKPVRKLC
jgi:hypothetical protein